jgi:crotonobetainyl-CoA:carnitine CoA-transferase CaiB-like acyl-CoA transferase
MKENNMCSLLENIKVVDLIRCCSGPFAAMRLADHGAEVIKIERLEEYENLKKVTLS